MKRKRHGTEEIIRKLREAEQLEATGQSLAQVCQKLEVSAATLARWRNQFRSMGDNEVKRLRTLEEENRANPSIFYEMETNMIQNYRKLHPDVSTGANQ